MPLEIVGRRRADQPAASKGVMTGLGETALTMATGAMAEPVAGLVGLATTPFQGLGSGAGNVQSVRNAMTYMPRSQEGQQYLQNVGEFIAPVTSRVDAAGKYLGEKGYENFGPLGGAIGSTLIPAIAEAVPGALGIRQMRRRYAPQPTLDPAGQPFSPLGETPPVLETSVKAVDQALPDLRAGKPEPLAAQVMPDLAVMQDAEALGISLNPEHYSTSRAFIDMQEALKSQAGSKLSMAEDKAIRDLGNRADQLIVDFGGYTDKDFLQQEVQSTFRNTIEDLGVQAGALFTSVAEKIPKSTKVTPRMTRSFLDGLMVDMGGKAGLTTAEMKLFDLINNVDEPPTYGRFNREREVIGMAIEGKNTPYSSTPIGDLKKLYGAMIEEQIDFADAFGMGDDLRDANKLTVRRKEIEAASIKLLGRELNNSMLKKVSDAALGLPSGNAANLRKLMQALPAELRQEAAATMLGDLFGGGSRRSTDMGGGFIKAFEGLNRNASSKEALFMYLPPEARVRFDMIGRVATGIYRAKNLENKSRTARDVIAALESGGLIAKMYGGLKDVAKAEGVGTAMGAPGVGTAAVIANKITSKATPAVQAADELLTSPKFRQAVQNHMTGATDQADALIRSTPEYKKWLAAQTGTVRAEVTAIGIIPWLTSDRQENP